MEEDELRLTMSELAELTGVHPSTIKFYISEGLLPRGELIASNRAIYVRSHVERLGFIRTLVTVGGVSIATIKGIVEALADGRLTSVLAAAQDAVRTPEDAPLATVAREAAVRQAFGINADSPLFHHPSIRRIAAAADASQPYLGETFPQWLDELIRAASEIARADLDMVTGARAQDAAQYAVVGIPLGDVLIAQSRRLWQSVFTSQSHGPGPVREPETSAKPEEDE